MKRLTWKQAADKMLKANGSEFIRVETCPGLGCSTCPFQNYPRKGGEGVGCEMIHNPAMKGQSAYEIARKRSRVVSDKLELI
jgi:hypothetical protein